MPHFQTLTFGSCSYMSARHRLVTSAVVCEAVLEPVTTADVAMPIVDVAPAAAAAAAPATPFSEAFSTVSAHDSRQACAPVLLLALQ